MWNLNCGSGSTGARRWRAEFDDQPASSWYQVTALHSAASKNDVDLIDALLEVGTNIDRPGSSNNGGPPIDSAARYGQPLAVWSSRAQPLMPPAGPRRLHGVDVMLADAPGLPGCPGG
jgi:ankyrin repeat protein